MQKNKNIFWGIILFLAIFVVLLAFQTRGNPVAQTQPLADPKVLSQLLLGHQPQIPADEHYGQFHGIQVTPPAISSLKQTSRILGVTSPTDKRIEVDLTHQRLYAYQGNQKVFNFIISSGKWFPTPTGTFTIWAKLKSTLMSGGEGADYYYLPNVPWVEFFYNNEIAKSRGFSLHGTYWHNNFGHPMSHGCVNMRTEDAATLFAWTSPIVTDPTLWATMATPENPGTEIVIYGEPPAE